MLLIIGLTAATLLLSVPLLWIARSDRRLTWTQAVLLGTYLTVIVTLLIAEIPSRFLYWFDAEHTNIADRFPITEAIMRGDQYIIVRDIVVNTVQGLFFVVILALAYVWGERQRRAGRFKS